jgi:cell division septation protein DedD
MAKLKTIFITLLTSPLIFSPFAICAENEDMEVTELIKSPFSFQLTGLYSDHFSSSGAKMELGYKPSTESGFIINVGLDHLSDISYKLNNIDFKHDFTNLRWSTGYKFELTNEFSITPSIGLAVNAVEVKQISLDSGTTQGYSNLTFAYDVSDSFSIVLEGSYDFGSNVLTDSSSVGLGFKYTPSHRAPVSTFKNESADPIQTISTTLDTDLTSDVKTDSPLIEDTLPITTAPSILASSVTGVIDDTLINSQVEELAPEESSMLVQDTFEDMPFTIQIGVFKNINSVNLYLKQNNIAEDQTYTREINGLIKIYYQGFETKSSASVSLRKLKGMGVDGFIVNTPVKQTTTKFVSMGSFYAVQLGSFSTLSSADPIITKLQSLDKQTFIKQSGELMKLYTGKFQEKANAETELAQLKENEINGFVTKLN